MLHPFFKVVKKTYIALVMLSTMKNIYAVGAQFGYPSNSHHDKYDKESGCANVQDYEYHNNYNNSAGFKYEESRCIDTQITAFGNEKELRHFAFDPSDKINGKNW